MDIASLPVIAFKSPQAWSQWLTKHYSAQKGVWVQLFKKASGKQTITYEQALEEALCWGWIDGQVKSLDTDSYVQKFTPRGPKSIWSKKNCQRIEQLVKEGRMKPSGISVVEAAKKDGRWDRAYDSPANMKMPADFLKELSKHPQAKAFFETLNKTNVYAIGWRLQTAKKPETRRARMQVILDLLKQGKKIHE
jgi:uncharacterized protein YdeI (YjbR/CyaY-like superfamily)